MMAMSVPRTEANMHPRAYQLEMLEASLKENIIVAMDTGSGKTQIAILRISKELEVCPASKMIWFLAPTVALCEQQHTVLTIHLPAIQIKLLVGRDNVDRWSSKHIWDIALYNVRVVVSTHAVLADALSHGFVVMENLALLIFDEAHNCVGKSPANKIMKIYHSQKTELDSTSRPKILGLTASPVIKKANPKELRAIEANLDSITRTPRINREELLRHVHFPELLDIHYFQERLGPQAGSSTLMSLRWHVEDGEKRWKKHSLHLLSVEETVKLSVSTITERKWSIPAQKQLRRLCTRAQYLQKELGSWASTYYITESINRATFSMHKQQNLRLSRKDEERIHILNTLGSVKAAEPGNSEPLHKPESISNKCITLLELLKNKYSKDFRGLIFVEQRVAAVVLCRLLSEHPETQQLFTCGTFVGTSTHESRTTELADFLDQSEQKNTLKDFREGKKNLVIATNALEEGIDVSACNVVVCFNKPSNLKSFIQRRGRARHEKSTFALLSASDDDSSLGAWKRLESKMVEEYMRESRELVQEDGSSSDERNDTRIFRVDSTRAQIDLESAIEHLHHFCATLPTYDYVDNRPTFTFHTEETTGFIRGLVTLPNLVNPQIRRASSLYTWQKEHMAAKDAAFEAYVALYKAGLLNDHLLPLREGDSFDVPGTTKDSSSMIKIGQQYNPWIDITKSHGNADNCYLTVVRIRVSGEVVLSTKLILPVHTRSLPWSPLPSKGDAHYEIYMEDSKEATKIDCTSSGLFQTATRLLLGPVHSSSIDSYPNFFGALFAPPIAHQELETWIRNYSNDIGGESAEGKRPSPISRKAELTNVTRLLYSPNQFGLFAPHIMHRLESVLVGEKLIERLHSDVCFERIDLVVEAISSPSACGLPDNNRLAFLGDTVLDLLITRQLFTTHKNWHEGYLSAKKKLIISNTHLSSMALQTGLDRFVITKPFSERTWKFLGISEIHTKDMGQKRRLSETTLADVVEALTGAAYLEGSFEKALQCIRAFLPEVTSHPVTPSNCSLLTVYNEEESNGIPHFLSLEKMISYKFRNKALSAEAMSHPSCEQDLTTGSYGRLALLGSSVLNMTIIKSLWHAETTISSNQMNLLRTATINKGFLAFICLETSLDKSYADIKQSSSQFSEVWHQRIALWAFMRHSHPDIVSEREEFLKRNADTCQRIREALASWKTYPWQEFAKLEANGYFSDIVRGLFGAVFIDSDGDMLQCSQLAEKLNILPRLRRLIQDNVDVMHPKTKLGELVGDRKVAYCSDVLLANTHHCIIRLDGQQIGEAQNGFCKQEAVIKAAESAIMILSKDEKISTIDMLLR